MDIEHLKETLARLDGLSKLLGMEFISTPEDDTCMARMQVALAENLAGVGSMALCPGQICVGINVSGSHVRSALEGDTVTAYARLQYKGRTLHEWHIDIKNSHDDLISTVQVTNYVMDTPRE